LINLSSENVEIQDGERIAQLVFCKVEQIAFEQVELLSDSDRGVGGFGSTGTK
jgi:dUTP pyrophosphatase